MRQYASVYAKKMIGSNGRLTVGLPRVVLTANMDLSRLHDLSMECCRFGLIQLAFVDTDVDVTKFNYWVPLNLKNIQSQVFFYDLLLEVYKRSAQKLRHKFLHVGRKIAEAAGTTTMAQQKHAVEKKPSSRFNND